MEIEEFNSNEFDVKSLAVEHYRDSEFGFIIDGAHTYLTKPDVANLVTWLTLRMEIGRDLDAGR